MEVGAGKNFDLTIYPKYTDFNLEVTRLYFKWETLKFLPLSWNEDLKAEANYYTHL